MGTLFCLLLYSTYGNIFLAPTVDRAHYGRFYHGTDFKLKLIILTKVNMLSQNELNTDTSIECVC